jgi:hypothetical protein
MPCRRQLIIYKQSWQMNSENPSHAPFTCHASMNKHIHGAQSVFPKILVVRFNSVSVNYSEIVFNEDYIRKFINFNSQVHFDRIRESALISI